MRSLGFCRVLAVPALLIAAAAAAFAADTYRVVHAYPHDPQAFTQGLVYAGGYLYESTGLYGRSSLRMENIETGQVLQRVNLPPQDFGEGLAAWGDTLIQLTWKAHLVFVYDRFSFRLLRTMHYGGEGWGLAEDGQHLILSDGSATLRFLDPATLKEVRHIVVKDGGAPVTQLNELEYVRGELYSNIWHTDRIARISPATGQVLGWIDLSGLLSADQRPDPEAVLNGIAYDPARNRLFVTGKLWPKLFEIEVAPQAAK